MRVTRRAAKLRQPRGFAAAAALSIVAIACTAASEPVPQTDPPIVPRAAIATTAPITASTWHTLWKVSTDGVLAGPLPIGRQVFVVTGADLDGDGPVFLNAFDIFTGEEIWQREFAGEINTDGGILYANRGEELQAIEPTSGQILWRFRPCGDSEVCQTRRWVYVAGGFVFGERDGQIYALDAAAALSAPVEPIWHGPAPGSDLLPALGGNRLYVAVGSHHLGAFEPDTGEWLWSKFTSEGEKPGYRGQIVTVTARDADREVSGEHIVYITDEEFLLTRRDPETGAIAPEWADSLGNPRKVPALRSPVWDPDDPETLYVIDHDGDVQAVDARTGQYLQRVAGQLRFPISQPVVQDRTLFVLELHRRVHRFDLEASTETEPFELKAPADQPIAVSQGVVVVADIGGNLTALLSPGANVPRS